MTEEEKEIIKSCSNITKSILEKIRYLYELEINGKKDTREYKEIVDSLKQAKGLEEALYSKIDCSVYIINRIIKEILGEEYDSSNGETFRMILDGDSNELMRCRMVQNLVGEINLNDNKSIKMHPLTDLRKSFHSDITNTIMYFLNIAMSDERYRDIRNQLLKYKYYLAFVFANLTDDMLDSNFEVKENLCWGMGIYREMYGFDDNFMKAFAAQNVFGIVEKVVNNLIQIPATRLDEKDVHAKAVMTQVIVRSIVLFLEREEVEGIKDVIAISSNAAKMLNGTSSLEDIILESLSTYDKDMEIPLRIGVKM